MHNSTLNTSMPISLRAFALISLIFHGIVLASWQTAPWIMGQTKDVLSVTLISEHSNPALTTARSAVQPTGANDRPANAANQLDRSKALPAATTQTSGRSINDAINFSKVTPRSSVQEAQNSELSLERTNAKENELEQTKAQIRARLKTDLARFFDYPYAARLRGWEGTVLLAFNIEANGRLERIHVARSSGYAVLDNSALSALRKVEHLVEINAWLQSREINMQIPITYKLNCADPLTCSENP
ncbi:MAG: energy transducer TonB [Gammaproteobacteria bacterium]|nr:energy transducer TonB [Gammaproteobacteria bacterium]